MKQETIFLNGKIYTLDHNHTIAEGMLIKNGKIVALGKSEELIKMCGQDTEVVDLEGRTVLPSFTDCHAHLLAAGHGAMLIDLAEKSKEEILELVRKKVEKTEPGKWIIGMGWNQDFWENSSFPTKEELDAISPHNPVKLTRYCGNAYWCNSLAIQLAGLQHEKEDGNAGKEFLLNEKGELQGTLVGEACRKIDAAIPAYDKQDIVTMLKNAEQNFFRHGITTIMDKGAGVESALATDCGRKIINILKELYEKQELQLRTYEAIVAEDEFFDDCFANGAEIDRYDGRFTVRGIKIWTDGALGPRSAWISEDYKGQPGHRGNKKFENEELIALFKKADEKNLQIAVHTIGDASSKQVIDCYEQAFCDSMDKDRRFLVEHFHLPKEEDIDRLTQYHMINSTQFIQLSSDMEVLKEIINDELIQRVYPWRKILNKGGILTNGSDVPVDPTDPFPALYVAISRKSLGGVNCIEKPPYQRLSRLEAVRAYTINAAYSMFSEKTRGSLEEGKYADFIVINQDYFTCPEEEIKEIKVLRTVLNGKTVYRQ